MNCGYDLEEDLWMNRECHTWKDLQDHLSKSLSGTDEETEARVANVLLRLQLA